MARRGSVQEKILLLLLGGFMLGISRTPKGYFKVLGSMHKSWKDINRRALIYSINSLYKSKLIAQKNNGDGTVTFVLSEEGKKTALTCNLDNMIVVKNHWDKKWRIVTFDIPEKLKRVRESLRYHLKRLGFIELQHSVFVIPFECKNEMEYLIEFYNVRRFVRLIEATSIDNELDLKNKFKLL